MTDEIWTVEELAKFLKVDPQTIRKEINRGKLAGFKVAAEYRFTQDDVQRYIEGHRVGKQEAQEVTA